MGLVEQVQSATGQASAGVRRRAWPASRVAAVALAMLAVVILAGSLTLYALTRQNLVENGGQAFIVFATFVTVGLIIAWHRPADHARARLRGERLSAPELVDLEVATVL